MSRSKVSNKYVKLDPIEHVIKRSSMYIGSIEEDQYETWIFDETTNKFKKTNIKYVPGFYKIYDELIVNSLDHIKRLKMDKKKNKNEVKTIKINIDRSENKIEVYNDGDGIDIEIHPEYIIYIPELIFANMLTSTNYDENEEKIMERYEWYRSKSM